VGIKRRTIGFKVKLGQYKNMIQNNYVRNVS